MVYAQNSRIFKFKEARFGDETSISETVVAL